MPIRVECECGKSLNVPDKLAGKKGKCPTCGAVLNIPAAAEGGDEAEAAVKAPPAKSSGGSGKKCPSCSKQWPADAVICVSCGTNMDTGEKLRTQT